MNAIQTMLTGATQNLSDAIVLLISVIVFLVDGYVGLLILKEFKSLLERR